jgi:hypothetical protein
MCVNIRACFGKLGFLLIPEGSKESSPAPKDFLSVFKGKNEEVLG